MNWSAKVDFDYYWAKPSKSVMFEVSKLARNKWQAQVRGKNKILLYGSYLDSLEKAVDWCEKEYRRRYALH